ncbi:MAG: DUF2066 domain-containing protein [Gammaproteobacteria bacterium]|nr:DUF2066 domain-containing protein [Gammaproteobacteria bacterium]
MLLLISPLSLAVEVKDLHVVEIPVADQTRKSRVEAYRTALAEVLLRYSGRGDVMFNPNTLAAMSEAHSFVKSYRYRKLDLQQAQEKGLEGEQLVLWVEMYPRSIKRLLRDNGLPIWGQVRPGMLSWVVLEQGGSRELLGAASSHPGLDIIRQQAAFRGQPLQFPLLDLVDKAAVNVSDVWGGFGDAVRQASLRYGDDVVFYGRIYSSGDHRWNADWSLILKEREWKWKIEGRDLASVIRPGIDLAVDAIAGSFAQTTVNTAANHTLVKVWNIQSLGDYAAVLRYLQKQVSVSEVIADTITQDSIVFRIRNEGDWQSVNKAISLGYRLYPFQPDESDTGEGAPSAVIHYRYLP